MTDWIKAADCTLPLSISGIIMGSFHRKMETFTKWKLGIWTILHWHFGDFAVPSFV